VGKTKRCRQSVSDDGVWGMVRWRVGDGRRVFCGLKCRGLIARRARRLRTFAEYRMSLLSDDADVKNERADRRIGHGPKKVAVRREGTPRKPTPAPDPPPTPPTALGIHGTHSTTPRVLEFYRRRRKIINRPGPVLYII